MIKILSKNISILHKKKEKKSPVKEYFDVFQRYISVLSVMLYLKTILNGAIVWGQGEICLAYFIFIFSIKERKKYETQL